MTTDDAPVVDAEDVSESGRLVQADEPLLTLLVDLLAEDSRQPPVSREDYVSRLSAAFAAPHSAELLAVIARARRPAGLVGSEDELSAVTASRGYLLEVVSRVLWRLREGRSVHVADVRRALLPFEGDD